MEVDRADRLTEILGYPENPYKSGNRGFMLNPRYGRFPALSEKWAGPFVVICSRGVCCLLRDDLGKVTRKTVKIRYLKKFVTRE